MAGEAPDGGDEEQMDWLFHDHAAGDVHERSIFGERRVQGAERVALDVEIASEMVSHYLRPICDFLWPDYSP